MFKRLDRYVLGKFCLIFVAAFFISLFIFMMQFMWVHIDKLVGKGLTMDILGQFFYYMSLTLVPQALPVGILLASLISFGNLGESLELLAMKSAGVALVRVMAPVGVMAAALGGVSFYFQNVTSPMAQQQLGALLMTLRQTSPAVEIPEGIFYNGVPNINLYVERKDVRTGMLYDLTIYKTDQGFDKAQIVVADSGRLAMSADKGHIILDIWQGEQFENLQSGGMGEMKNASQPHDRETFGHKRFLIDFDSDFKVMDADMLSGMAKAKNMVQIVESVDSMNADLDSLGHSSYERELGKTYFAPPTAQQTKAAARAKTAALPFDTLMARLAPERRDAVMATAAGEVKRTVSELDFRQEEVKAMEKDVRKHWIEWHTKISSSLACFLFFLIGAPLGAIIRKGGLGLPAVVSVIIFIIYLIINTSTMKMARDGSLNMLVGMWTSTAILLPTGIFLTYKSNNDSVVFNLDAYRNFFARLLMLRTRRHVALKEVIIHDPDYAALAPRLAALEADSRRYVEDHRLVSAPNYLHIFFRHTPDTAVADLDARMEAVADELGNSRDARVLHDLGRLPILYTTAHVTPFASDRWNKAAGILLPVGAVLWLRIWIFRVRLRKDLLQIADTARALQEHCKRLCDNTAKKL
ncbi:MAG: LptF/LptG family permease [Bacteroidaceae bacterium]|nr:LptF/LptG family permease [Bacteroidaceae bacterium]